MAEADDTFSSWLLTKLNRMNVDENIFLNYVVSILEGEETRDEKLDILKSVFGDCSFTEDEIDVHCVEILDHWQQAVSIASNKKDTVKIVENVDQKLARLLESNVQLEDTAPTCKYTDDELKIREAILSKYSHADESENESEAEGKELDDLEKNTNATAIHQAEKEKREKAKLENQKKKERDKLEREKQKLTLQEKKEARRKRAQKVEHHRK